MDQKKSVPFEKLLQAVALGNTEPEVISSVAARIARLMKRLDDPEKTEIEKHTHGKSLKDLTSDLVDSLDADRHVEQAKQENKTEQPNEEQIRQAKKKLIQDAVKPLFNPDLRNLLVEFHKKTEQTIDHVSQDKVIEAGFSADALEKAKGVVQSFEKFIQDHKDEITALQVLYSRPFTGLAFGLRTSRIWRTPLRSRPTCGLSHNSGKPMQPSTNPRSRGQGPSAS